MNKCQSAPDVHFLSVFPFDLSVLIIFLILTIFNSFTENCLRKLLHFMEKLLLLLKLLLNYIPNSTYSLYT